MIIFSSVGVTAPKMLVWESTELVVDVDEEDMVEETDEWMCMALVCVVKYELESAYIGVKLIF